MVSTLRLEDISICNYIKYELLAKEFVEELTNIDVEISSGSYLPVLEGYDPSPISRGRGLVAFDDTLVNNKYVVDVTSEQTSKTTVTGPSSYTLNYTTGEITDFDVAPTSMDFYWYYVAVLDAWPGKTPPDLPLVSVDITSSSSAPFQLGGGKKNIRVLVLDIFATNRAERDEITDTLESGLYNRTITVKDYSLGNYLDYSGTYNSSFDHTPVSTSPIFITDVSARFLGADVSWDIMNRYRSRIDVYYESISDTT